MRTSPDAYLDTYLDTSAAAKLLVLEPESVALVAHLSAVAGSRHEVVSSVLLETELRRLAVREGLAQVDVSGVLARIALAEPDRALFTEAGLLPGPHLRSLDALHVATALRLQVSSFLTYDTRQAAAAASVGLIVIAPGQA